MYLSHVPPPTLIPVQPRPKPASRLALPALIPDLPVSGASMPSPIVPRPYPISTPESSSHHPQPPTSSTDPVPPPNFGVAPVVTMPDPKPPQPLAPAAFGVFTTAASNPPSNGPRIQVGSLDGPQTSPLQLENRVQVASAGFGATARDGSVPVKSGSVTTGSFGDRADARPGEGLQARSSATTGAVGTVNPNEPKVTTKAPVMQSAFGAVVARTAGPVNRSQSSNGQSAALEILEKPHPAYSEEARRLHIEGEIVLEMLFPATGQPTVLRVIRGLGHGLDENAATAALAIRFRPATERGEVVDTVATVRIEFQLAF